MINKGLKVLDDPVADIQRRYDPRVIEFDPLDPQADLSPLRSIPEVEDLERTDHGCRVVLREGSSAPSVIPRLAIAVPPARIEIARPTLEDVFVKLVAA
jgi:ABC-type uncharacterized transport system ATPase subunit